MSFFRSTFRLLQLSKYQPSINLQQKRLLSTDDPYTSLNQINGLSGADLISLYRREKLICMYNPFLDDQLLQVTNSPDSLNNIDEEEQTLVVCAAAIGVDKNAIQYVKHPMIKLVLEDMLKKWKEEQEQEKASNDFPTA
ncbi:MAG: hypothetical protein Homavirus8_7 [Homavirus sp.]|uniref:Uncharacterized protein n=1 Tax=Homavirus sp. TaxID=2487769 RepID=A0A3G5A6L0_9VIRU|nr:MAG: hypothetical protein Homavirus8_7 [Homavirus sp.]